jgi:hydroxymethylpyrimidine kinase/phosphomethylpyrimidine kinase
MTTPIALTIAGSDSSGGAGIQADLKTFAALGVYGASVVTALTAQNTTGVSGIHQVPPEFVTAQIDAVFSDLAVGAVKIGMVAQLASIDAIAAALTRWSPRHVVLDPVMVATSGDRLLVAEAVDALRSKLIPRASVITPNLPEAAVLLDEPIAESEAAVEYQGKRLLAMGCDAVLIKGGDRRRPCKGRRDGSRRAQRQSLDQRRDRGCGPVQRRPWPRADPSFSRVLLKRLVEADALRRRFSSERRAVDALSVEILRHLAGFMPARYRDCGDGPRR